MYKGHARCYRYCTPTPMFQGINHFIIATLPTAQESLTVWAVPSPYVLTYLLSFSLFFFSLFLTFYPFNSIFISKAIINTQWLRKRIPITITKLQFKDSRLHCRKCIFKYSCVTQRTTAVPYCTLTPQSPFSRVRCGAVHGPQPRQDHLPLAVQVALGARVQALHQELLVEQWVICPECAGRVVVELVIVAKLSLPDGWDVLIHMHLAAQGHHDEDA